MLDNRDTNIRDLDAAAVAASLDVVAQVRDEHLDQPTPCADWDVRALLAHMTVQHHGFAAAAEGRGGDPAVWAVPSMPSMPSTDPVTDYRHAADRVTAAFGVVDLDTDRFALHEFGVDAAFPATVAMGFHFIDYLAHAWDVGVAIGVDATPHANLLPAALAITAQVPTGAARTQPGAPFGPALDDRSADDDSWERMLLLLGRSPLWRPGD